MKGHQEPLDALNRSKFAVGATPRGRPARADKIPGSHTGLPLHGRLCRGNTLNLPGKGMARHARRLHPQKWDVH
ncbi:hypothetical protein ANRL4_00589 [Anaerolineae bacterium]|nr:hypothetical protein ANRL4_00589 [Anaerolineae bacterium]